MMAKAKPSINDMGRVAGRIVDETISEIDFSVRVTRADFRRRWRTVQDAMKEKGYDLGYACGSELDRSDAIIPADGPPVLLAGCEGNHVVQEVAEACGAQIAVLRDFGLSDEEYTHVRCDNFHDVVRRLKLECNPRVAIFSAGE